jgi:RNA polymerase sigma factor (sigma-70 family)
MQSISPAGIGPPDGPPATMFECAPAESFDGFYRRELAGLIAFACALAGSACAEDIAQDAMLAAYRRWDHVAQLDIPAAWVRRVCANRAVSTLRRRSVEARAMLRLGSRGTDVEPMAAAHESFWAEVRKLPRRQAQVIALHYIYDLGVAEIARTLGCAEGTVKVHLSRGRAALGNRLFPPQVEQI